MARIQVIDPNEATGRLKDIYENLVQRRGKLAEVHKIQSLNPATIQSYMSLYMDIMFRSSPLSRAEREMIAVVVSRANGCEYCQNHHSSALEHFWKDAGRVKAFRKDWTSVSLNDREYALCTYAEEVTLRPSNSGKSDPTEVLRKVGLEDRAILDATLVLSYFNFVNRMVLALEVSLEDHQGKGFRFEVKE